MTGEHPVAPAATYDVAVVGAAFAVLCNGQVLKTPAARDYVLPAVALAEAVAAEWRAQGAKPKPASMPMTQLAATALDILPKQRARIIDQLVAYTDTELLCHRAATPESLAALQRTIWQPYLDWCALRFDALLRVSEGIVPVAQPAIAVAALRRVLEAYDDFWLAGAGAAVDAAGSLVLGLALAEKFQGAGDVFAAAELDSGYQIERWGADEELTARRDGVKVELEGCERWFEGLR